ncbi:hypothetical protein [Clostridium beijerinckii]|uniref:hypothetical protein n=1 Tax=Clostridium beijerinckii TaxID=1520 RepID=UPI00080A4899|nr:hypothetical protein [Clostridium beijerinckii]OCA98717.1 hypothetical protein BGS1_22800 [Clostridium beijerinckii]
MGAFIRGFIGRKEIIDELLSKEWLNRKVQYLSQGFALLFLTDEFYDDILELADECEKSEFPWNNISTFLNSSILNILENKSTNQNTIGYLELDFFGGVGEQIATLYENGKMVIEPIKTELQWNYEGNLTVKKSVPEGINDGAINFVLKHMGVQRDRNKDEFNSLGLEKIRYMPE